MTATLTVPDLEPNEDGGAVLRCDSAMFRRIVETANEGIWQTDAEFRATFVNSRMAEMLGYAPEDILGYPIRDFMLPEEIADHERRMREHRRGVCDRFERRLRHRDGHTVTVLVSVTSLLDEDGVFQGAFAMLTDITERKRAEQALAESESRYRHLFDLESDAIFLIDNETGRILETNRAAEVLYGYSRAELLQRKNTDLSAEPEQTHKLTQEGGAIQQERGGKPVLILVRWHRNREGVVFPVEITGQHSVWHGRAVHIAAIRDITERLRMMADLRASEARFRSIFELSPLGIGLVSQRDQRFMQANQRFCELLGYSLEELRGMTVAEVTHPDDWHQSRHLFQTLPTEKQSVCTLRKRYLRKDGAVRWVNFTTSQFPSQAGEEPLVIGVVEDITERQEAEEHIRHLALHDALTDLPNRALLQDRLRQAMSEAQRKQTLMALLFLDLDRFKIVNDSLGHSVGDRMLCVVAERLGHHVRGSDTVSRLGGDEFVVVLTAIHDASDAARITAKLLESLAEPLIVDDHTLNVSASIGVSLYPMDGRDPETLLQHADTALYQAKASGRNNYQFFSQEMSVRARERLQLEHDLRQALEQDEFRLHYQPQIDCFTGRVVAVEALLRWRHPELGWVPPERFIPIAEDSGLIIPIGEWALGKACRDSRTWRCAGLEHGTITLNLSALQLQRAGFSARLAKTLRETGIQPGDLELELTESLLINQANAATLRQLKEMGVVLCIDDFGAGNSSLNHLRRFAIDKLKLDGSLLRDVVDNADASTIMNAIVTVAHCMRLAVVAEGVETPEQVEFLRQRNCHQMQGYYFSLPQPAEGLTAWLVQRAESR